MSGIGIKLCALSDGVASLAASQAAGELPAVDVLPGQAGSGDEGTAMLQIMHDLAPGAELGFATAFTSAASFADNIRKLRFDADCDVIVDDVIYYTEAAFQDGPIAQAVNAVTADGALFFSSAGNEGNTLDGTSSHYEGDFAGSGQRVGKIFGEAHDWDPGPGVQLFNPLSAASIGSVVTMFWAEPLGRATSDYDFYLFDSAGTLVEFAQNVQDGNDDAYERFNMDTVASGYRLAVVRYAGEPRYFEVTAYGGRFKASADGLPAWATPGVTRGHSAAVDAFSVAAAPANLPYGTLLEPGDPPNPRGPFPEVFTMSQLPERFTSDGPRRIFFAADGTPAPQVRQKPEITAADGVVTTAPGFARFFGTSASAPHAAAIAGARALRQPDRDRDRPARGLRCDRARPRPRGRRQPHRPRHHPRRSRARVHRRHAAAARACPATAGGRDHRRRRHLSWSRGRAPRSRSRWPTSATGRPRASASPSRPTTRSRS